MTEHFDHDDCPKCGTPSEPAEDVSDQTYRHCPKCGHVWGEDLSSPPKKAQEDFYLQQGMDDSNHILHAQTERAREWCESNLRKTDLYDGDNFLADNLKTMQGIIARLLKAGFTVETFDGFK